jgi:hydroxymethylpyrimidine pyrophosphatase-like HAD family hydrolase
MRYHVLACDFDGTLARHGKVDEDTLAALEKLLATGRKLLLVTGRVLPELKTVFPPLHLFSWVVAENGALLYRPATREEKLLTSPPPEPLIQALRRRGVEPLSVGQAILATWRPNEIAALECIRDRGLEYQVIFNKDAVMMLPGGVNKATGLQAVLKEMQLSTHETVGIGDAENDHAFLRLCECAVAVANAVPAIKDSVDFVTAGDHGAGVRELIEELVANDLAGREDRLTRHHLRLGVRRDGSEAILPTYDLSLLIAGPSGSGKSTAATSFLERLLEQKYQFCLIDPEGDYDALPEGIIIGNRQHEPTADEVMQILATSDDHAVVNLVGMAVTERPSFFLSLLPQLLEMRARTGRPHWLIVDEAHHLLPSSWQPGPLVLPGDLKRLLFITVHPNQVSGGALAFVNLLIAVGASPEKTVADFCSALGECPPPPEPILLDEDEVYLWSRSPALASGPVRLVPSKIERRRHIRKYAEGELPPERSFYFRGPEGKLNLRAQNLILFLQLAEGVDEATWKFHLDQGDYSRWFRERIKDDTLADEAVAIEQRTDLPAEESRALIRALIEKHYTLPAGQPLPMPNTDAAPVYQKDQLDQTGKPR